MDADDLTEQEFETYKWLVRSTGRIKRLKDFDEPKTISAVTENFEVNRDTMSKQVKDLREENLLEPLNPDANKGILYQQTEKAEKILKLVE